jgi:iron complex transport system substrate-binding protein
VRIVSLVPSATEIVFALGLADALVGVTDECDYPPAASAKPVVSRSALQEASPTAREIDDAVRAMVAAGESLYLLDREYIASVAPDLILAQDLCRVCAVPSGALEEALAVLGCHARVISLDPTTLDEVIASIGVVGEATGTGKRASQLMASLHERIEAVRDAVAARPRPRVLPLEWSDPPFSGGHWVPDMVDIGGGVPVLSTRGSDSRQLSWDEVAQGDAEVVVFMPCGYDLARATAEGRELLSRPELARAGRIVAVEANAYFSRPGPRLVDGVELLASLLHPGAVKAPKPAATVLR